MSSAFSAQQHAYAAAGAAIFFWATVATAFKLTLRSMGVLDLLMLSSLSSCAVLAMVLVFSGSLRNVFRWPARSYLRSVALGALNPFLYYLVLFKAYDLLPAQEAQPLNYTWPLLLVLFSVLFLRQRATVWMFVALAVSFAGVVVIATHGDVVSLHFTDTYGVLLATGSSAIWATYWIVAMRDDRDPVERLLVSSVFGTVFVAVLYIAGGHLRALPLEGVLGGVYVGCFEMGVTFVLWLRALQRSAHAALVSNLVYLSPFLSLVVIHFVLGEEVRLSTIAGLLLIVSGIVLQRATARPVTVSTIATSEESTRTNHS
jgi:drug/metabolite transporter (DMT)-like permease